MYIAIIEELEISIQMLRIHHVVTLSPHPNPYGHACLVPVIYELHNAYITILYSLQTYDIQIAELIYNSYITMKS